MEGSWHLKIFQHLEADVKPLICIASSCPAPWIYLLSLLNESSCYLVCMQEAISEQRLPN